MSEETVQTEVGHEAVAEGGVAASLGLNTQLFGFQLLNFTIVGLIVWWLILKPLTKKMAERQQIINESLTKAETIEANFLLADQKARETLDDAKVQSNQIVGAATAEARLQAEKLKAEAKVEIDELVAKAKQHIKDEKQLAKVELQREMGKLVAEATAKVLGAAVDAKVDEKVITSALKDLSATQE